LDLCLVGVYGSLLIAFGIEPVLAAILPVLLIASWIGGWLFFVQHQYEGTLWDSAVDWDFHVAAISGSSYYALPRLLRWFTGSIGLHHIHHLCSKIPNYRLQQCLEENPVLEQIGRVTLVESLSCLRLALWDEEQRKLVGFRDLRGLRTA